MRPKSLAMRKFKSKKLRLEERLLKKMCFLKQSINKKLRNRLSNQNNRKKPLRNHNQYNKPPK